MKCTAFTIPLTPPRGSWDRVGVGACAEAAELSVLHSLRSADNTVGLEPRWPLIQRTGPLRVSKQLIASQQFVLCVLVLGGRADGSNRPP